MSQQSFADLGVSKPVVQALAARRIVEPFPVQRLVIPDVLAGRDVLVQSPTGSGKTLAVRVPPLDRADAATDRALPHGGGQAAPVRPPAAPPRGARSRPPLRPRPRAAPRARQSDRGRARRGR